MPAPNPVPGTRICLTVAPDGVKLYGNREAFGSLAQFMSWIAESDPAEHFECHVRWHLSSEETLFHGASPNVATLIAPPLVAHLSPATESDTGFELTFMAVEEGDLDEMFEHASSGVLPEEWGSSSE